MAGTGMFFNSQSKRTLPENYTVTLKTDFAEYDDTNRLKTREKLEMPGIEPGAFRMQSGRSTTEPHPLWRIFPVVRYYACLRLAASIDFLRLLLVSIFD